MNTLYLWITSFVTRSTRKKCKIKTENPNKPWTFLLEKRICELSFCRYLTLKVFQMLQLPTKDQKTMSQSSAAIVWRSERVYWRQTFQSPARGPATTPASITSMQTKGCWRFGARFRAWARANFKISNASPRGSNLSVL